MGKNIEKLRRKDICIQCKNLKPIKAKKQCQNCWHKYKRKYNLNFFLRTRYTELVQRCINSNNTASKYYYGKKYCSRDEFLNKFSNNDNLKKLYKTWQDSNFKYNLCPSIDRIDNNKDYTLNNIQFITHGENSLKDQYTLSIDVYKNNLLLSSHESLNDAVRFYNVQQSNAWKVVYGVRKHTCGYVFKIRKNP